jgi:hypothetical protein
MQTLDAIDDAADTDTDTDTNTAIVPAVSTSPPAGHRLVNPFVLFRQQNASGGFFSGDLIKLDHNTGKVLRTRGNDATVVEPDQCRYVVNPNGMVDRWVKFVNGKPAEQKVYRTAEGEMAPEREALDDIDWKSRGYKKDPWQREVYLPMRGTDGEVVAFKATGKSAISEIGELVGMYGSADRHGKVPVVQIENRSFVNTEHGNTIYVPVFRLVSWELWDGQPVPTAQPVAVPIAPPPSPARATLAAPPPNKGGDMDDEIPF